MNFKKEEESHHPILKKKICFVTTIEMTAKTFLLEHMKAMGERYDVSLILNTDNKDFLKSYGLCVTVIPVVIERKISLWKDIKAITDLFLLFRRNRFCVVHSIMHKSGLLAMIASFFAGVPNRLHTFTGQLWVTRANPARSFHKNIDRLTVLFATNILIDSNSQRDLLISERIVAARKATVLGKGSITGVDTSKFCPNGQVRILLRSKFGISEDDLVILFVGRLTIDKGLKDLAEAFLKVYGVCDKVHLLIVGPDEEDMRSAVLDICSLCADKVHFEDYTDFPEHYMAAADILCLPSYREGFGNVVIEAASVGIPSIGTRIYGVSDAIEDGVTGILYKPRDVNALARHLMRFVEDADFRHQIGNNAQQRTVRNFTKEILVSALLEYYETLRHLTH